MIDWNGFHLQEPAISRHTSIKYAFICNLLSNALNSMSICVSVGLIFTILFLILSSCGIFTSILLLYGLHRVSKYYLSNDIIAHSYALFSLVPGLQNSVNSMDYCHYCNDTGRHCIRDVLFYYNSGKIISIALFCYVKQFFIWNFQLEWNPVAGILTTVDLFLICLNVRIQTPNFEYWNKSSFFRCMPYFVWYLSTKNWKLAAAEL